MCEHDKLTRREGDNDDLKHQHFAPPGEVISLFEWDWTAAIERGGSEAGGQYIKGQNQA